MNTEAIISKKEYEPKAENLQNPEGVPSLGLDAFASHYILFKYSF